MKKTRIASHTKSLNDLPFDSLCRNLDGKPNKYKNFIRLLNTFDFLEVNDFKTDSEMVLAMLTKLAMNMLFDDLTKDIDYLCKYVEKIFFTMFEVSSANVKAATRNRIRLTTTYNSIKTLLDDVKYIVPNTVVYKTLGVNRRESYRFIIDLIFVNAKNELSILNILPHVENMTSGSIEETHLDPVTAPKFVMALDYLLEANLNVSNCYTLSISRTDVNKAYLIRTSVTPFVKTLIAKHNTIHLSDKANINFCALCPYRYSCTPGDYK